MSRREIATLACKIIAVYLFAQCLLYGGGVMLTIIYLGIEMVRTRFDTALLMTPLITLIPGLGIGAIGWLLWAKAEVIGARMVDGDPTPVMLTTATAGDLMSIALAVAGVFVLISGGQGIFRKFAVMLSGRYPMAAYREDPAWIGELVGYVLEAAIGLWLIFGSRGISNMIRRLRSTSYDHPPQDA